MPLRPAPGLQTLPPSFILALPVDLADHIVLAQACRSLRAVYLRDEQGGGERFWRSACFRTGYGRPGRPHNGEQMAWREIALLIVSHRKWCRAGCCTEAGSWFSGPRELRLPAPAASPFTSPYPTPPLQFPPSAQTSSSVSTTMHPLHHTFHCAAHAAPDAAPDPFAILATHLPAASTIAPLCAHPPASCAFATYPPVRRLSLFCCPNEPGGKAVCVRVRNPDGCTLLDINRALAEAFLSEPTSQPTLAYTALMHYVALLQSLPGHPRAHITPEAVEELHERLAAQRGFLGDHEYPYLYALQDFLAVEE